MDCPACHHPNVDGARFCASCGALLPLPSAESQDALLGQIIADRYRITKLLGEGGMGRVYIAEQQMGTSVRKVAVKTLHAQFANDAQLLARFKRECGTVSELQHPNTIQFFDSGQTPDGQLYIVMEYCQGQSLSSALEQGPMAPQRVLHILMQVCGSLEEAHNHGVVHRDLKPDNVILSLRAGQADFVKVLDFGIAKRRDAQDQAQEQKLTQQGMVLGTPPYMSPEQFTGQELDGRSDIYSLGVMAYEMLTGKLPFQANTPWEWATQHMTSQPFPFETTASGAYLPPSMKNAIMRALSKKRDERQSTARQFYEEIAGIAPGVQPSAGGGTGTTAMPMPPRIDAGSNLTPGAPAIGGAHGTAQMPTPPAMGVPTGGFAGTPPGQAVGYGPPPRPAEPIPQPSRPGPNKGLVIGLGSLAAVLLVAGIIIALRNPTAGDAPPPSGTNTVGNITNPGATSITETTPSTTTVGDFKPVDPGSGGGPIAGGETPGTGGSKPAGRSTAPAAPPPQVNPEVACKNAKSDAENQQVDKALADYASCSGDMKEPAKRAMVANLPKTIGFIVRNGECAKARSLVDRAKRAGITSAEADAKVQSCR